MPSKQSSGKPFPPDIERVLQLVYPELRRRAHAYMHGERAGHTLQPTALVHEALLKLLGEKDINYEDHHHFFRIVSRRMRQVLVDRARRKLATRNGANLSQVVTEWEKIPAQDEQDMVQSILVSESVEQLQHTDPRLA